MPFPDRGTGDEGCKAACPQDPLPAQNSAELRAETRARIRCQIRALERSAPKADVIALPFGTPLLDHHLPEGGLLRGALHEAAGGGADAVHAAAATLFLAGIAARLPGGPVLWCAATDDLFPPGLACAGLHPSRVLHVTPPDEASALAVLEEGLRHPALAAVVGELTRLPNVASRRLALAAEKSGVTALILRRKREGREPVRELSAAVTRWRVTPLPSAQNGPGMGRARWTLELVRCRGGEPGEWVVEACDAQGRLGVPAALEHRQGAVA